MAKVLRTVSIDPDVDEFHRLKNTGRVSEIVNDYLKALMGDNFSLSKIENKEALITTVEKDLAKLKVEQLQFEKDIERRKAESLKEENQRTEAFMQSDDFLHNMREMKTLKDLSSKIAAERYEIIMESLMQNTGKDRTELEKMIASKKKSGEGVTLKKVKG